MHWFISAGEPSGDLHGANLIRALRRHTPHARFSGFGGPHMTDAGAQLLYPLTDLAVMWFGRVLSNIGTFVRLVRQAGDFFERERPDGVVLIDYPGLHWHIARRAKAAGIPVYYFVPPQLWAWAGWRVKKMRANVHTVLTALEFEEEWYRSRGVPTHYVGHPYFDELSAQVLDQAFMDGLRRDPRRVVGLLPGSRNQEVAGNLPLMLNAARRIHAARPGVRFLVAAYREHQAAMVRERLAGSGLPAEVHVGRTPEIIDRADACVAVSGSVGLEMLYRRKPAVVVYRVSHFLNMLGKCLKNCEYISLVNLLANEELYPEFITTRSDVPAIAERVLHWLDHPESLADCTAKLTHLRNRVARPGACERAAAFIASAGAARRAA